MKTANSLCLLMLAIWLTACGVHSIETRRNAAVEIARNAGFKSFLINTGTFRLAGFHKLGSSSGNVSVYIEGDGLAWIDRRTVSRNPTPMTPLGLKLATLDVGDRVVYLARPCQYVDLSAEANCHRKYWTSHRFAKEVLDSYHHALDELRTELGYSGVHLIGFSGGGAIAALLAAQRGDVLSLRTVAGNLDPVALNKFRAVTPLYGSQDPMGQASKLNTLPQIHYSGADDEIVPGWVAKSFVGAVGNGNCTRVEVISGADHLGGWVAKWNSLSQHIPSC